MPRNQFQLYYGKGVTNAGEGGGVQIMPRFVWLLARQPNPPFLSMAQNGTGNRYSQPRRLWSNTPALKDLVRFDPGLESTEAGWYFFGQL